MSIQSHSKQIATHRESAIAKKLMHDASSMPFTTSSLNVAVIDRNALFGECLCAGLKAASADVTFTLYDSIDMWLTGSSPPCEDPLLICLDSKEIDQVIRNENENISRLLRAGLPTRFVILSSEDEPNYPLKALEIGASGYISTNMHLAVVVQVLRLVHAGGTFIPASSLQRMSAPLGEANVAAPLELSGLSPRQILVAKALRRGTPNKLIAYDLNMCESTVKVHVRQIMKKLKAKNRTQVAFLTNSMFPD